MVVGRGMNEQEGGVIGNDTIVRGFLVYQELGFPFLVDAP